MAIYRGNWHGERFYFGLHYDLHANAGDTDLGTRCGEADLVPMLELMGPDFVQTDCKGHPGQTSWFSRVPDATVSPGVVKDAMEQWRAATRKLGMPLHCHYSGIWDKAAGEKHPEWCVQTHEGQAAGAPFGANAGKPTGEKMCPRSGYLENLLIPQMLELIDRYGVDGFWVDGDLWGVEPCYCERCRAAFSARTGIATPPADEKDPHWPAWWNFTRESFEEYVTRYCDAVHAHKPGVLVCSNWLQTFKHPGEPKVPTDWISGDNAWVWGLDGSRCEARFLSTRGKPWDIMLWSFYCSHGMGRTDSPWTMKPAQMLQQEAAVLLSFGGNVQVYEAATGLRSGQLVPWRMQRLRAMGRFVKHRQALCQGGETIPQVAILHSEHHLRAKPSGRNLMWNVDVAPVQGAVFSALECSYGVDILDEWALLDRLDEFPLIVAPEQDRMSDAMAAALKRYVARGGRLMLTGAAVYERFGGEFLGVTAGRIEESKAYQAPAADGMVPVYSATWRLLECAGAKSLGELGTTSLTDDRLLPHPAATLHPVGRGSVLYVPCDLFRDFQHNRYPMTREFVRECLRPLAGRLPIIVRAPACIDVALRKQGRRLLIHFVNRGSGIPNQPANGAIDEIPPVGPIAVRIRCPKTPRRVRLAFESEEVEWAWADGELRAVVHAVCIHAALVVDP
jgi:hypothetical protein